MPLCLDETISFGFIANIQGIRVPPTGVDPGTVLEPLAKRFPRLVIHFATLMQAELDALVGASIQTARYGRRAYAERSIFLS